MDEKDGRREEQHIKLAIDFKEQVNTSFFLDNLKSFKVLVFFVIMSLMFRSLMPIIAYVMFFFMFELAFIVLNKKDRIRNEILSDNKVKRKQRIMAQIVMLEYEEDVDCDYVTICCEYHLGNGKKKIFKCKSIFNELEWEVGDKIPVMIDPENYNNYEILFNEK